MACLSLSRLFTLHTAVGEELRTEDEGTMTRRYVRREKGKRKGRDRPFVLRSCHTVGLSLMLHSLPPSFHSGGLRPE